MPAHNLYVALYDPATDEVSFPLAVEEDRTVRWKSRRAGNGLTEHVLRTCAPLLIHSDLAATLARLQITAIGRPAASWLGVPICAGQESLGVMAVQSFSPAELYDEAHREVLVTIATQAAVAVRNAHLYARTDEALARRVQELDSILRTAQEGILLLDTAWRVLAANRTLAQFLGLAQGELTGTLRGTTDGDSPLVARLGYTVDSLAVDCQALLQEESAFLRQTIVAPGPPERPAERTLTPVRNREGSVTGWLIVLRDLTEERELARLREEMTHLLIHDLRSPLTVMQGSLSLIDRLLRQERYGDLPELLAMAGHGNEQLLDMINQLLDISRLESEQVPLQREPIAVAELLQRVVERFAPLARTTEIDLQAVAAPDLPPLHADPVLIGRVLGNLVDNALKFTPNQGQVRLWARPAPDDEAPGLLIGVRDSGPGIPAEHIGQLFQKFQQVKSQAGRRRGTGLGLYFCRLVVESHGGRIWVESEECHGSNFQLRLPLA
jgi:signal transduction histidine kinase